MSNQPYILPTLEELLSSSSPSADALPSLREELRQLAQGSDDLRLHTQASPAPIRWSNPPPSITIPSASTSASTSTSSAEFPNLLSSLAAHRLPRPSASPGQPRIVRSSPRPSLSPTRRRSSLHAAAAQSPVSPTTPTPPAPYLRPRGPSYLSTLPAPGFQLPSYLSHSAFLPLLHTGPAPPGDAPKPADYVLFRSPSPPSRTGPRHSDSDTEISLPALRRRTRSGPIPAPAPTPTAPPPDTPLYLPTQWSATDRCPAIQVSSDGLTLSYTGAGGNGDKDAATVRADHPVPPACGIHYYECEVVDRGQAGYISLGWCTKAMPLARLPGWERDSWGYHGDDGHCFTYANSGVPYGPKFTAGDVIGCGVDFTQGCAFYTKNGLFLGNVFSSLPSAGPLYPCVGLRTPNESVRTNFGQRDFIFDIDGHVVRRKLAVRKEILFDAGDAAELGRRRQRAGTGEGKKKEEKGKARAEVAGVEGGEGKAEGRVDLEALVLDYLAHHAYADSALALARDSAARVIPAITPASASSSSTNMDVDPDPNAEPTEPMEPIDLPSSPQPPPSSSSMHARQLIISHIRAGAIDPALALLHAHWPELLSPSMLTLLDAGYGEGPELLCRLECRKFVELMLLASSSPTPSRPAPAEEQEPRPKLAPSPPSPELAAALAFGQVLHHRYSDAPSADMRALLGRTFSLLAYARPGEAAELGGMVGQEAREELAGWVNEVVLRYEGHADRPAIARAWAGAKTVMAQLAALGQGSAAYLNVDEEFGEGRRGQALQQAA